MKKQRKGGQQSGLQGSLQAVDVVMAKPTPTTHYVNVKMSPRPTPQILHADVADVQASLERARAARMKRVKKDDGLVGTAAAAESLGISEAQFRRIAAARALVPDKTYTNPHHRSGPPAQLWSRRTLARLARTRDVGAAREQRGGKASKDYASLFAARYGRPADALADACEALFNLNRYSRHSTCSDSHREEIFSLKSSLIAHLYRLERFTDRVEKVTKHLPRKQCVRCEGTGVGHQGECNKCDGTGVFEEARDVASYVFSFAIDDQRYTWVQPDHVMTFAPRVEATRADDGKRHELDPTINIPRSKLAEAKALIRYAIGEAAP